MKVFVIAYEACRLPEPDRAGFLRERCGGDAELEAQVRGVIAKQEERARQEQPSPRPVVDSPADLEMAVPGYQFGRLLGMGGMGEVYEVHEQRLGRTLALKTIRPEYASHSGAKKRFVAEMTITAKLQHPGLVPIHDSGTLSDGRPYYVMKVVQGQTLSALLAARPHPLNDLNQFVQIFVQLCNPLAYVHTAGVVHRDLKPDNVMVGAFGEVQIVDWGLARSVVGEDPATPSDGSALGGPPELGTTAGAIIGTPAFMSPEQARSETNAARPATDIYSLGAILFVILTGKPPIVGHVAEVLDRVRAGDVPAPRTLNPKVPGGLDAICRKAMASDPTGRYATVRELEEDVLRWIRDEDVLAGGESWTTRARRRMKGHRLKVTGAAALLVAAIPLSIALAIISENAREQAVNDAKRITDEKLESDRQRNRADQNFALADRVASDTVRQVISNPRLKEGDFLSARRVMLEQLAPVYDKLVAQKAEDPRLAADTGREYSLLGQVQRDSGSPKEAIANLEKSRAAFASLAAADPENTEYKRQLGNAEQELGQTLYYLAQFPEAIDHLTRARLSLEPLAISQGSTPEIKLDASTALTSLSLALHEVGRLEEAESAARAGLAVLEPLSVDPLHSELDPRRHAAVLWSNLGLLLRDQRKYTEATNAYDKAIKINDDLIRDYPDLRGYRLAGIAARTNLSFLASNTGDPARAEEYARAADRLATPLATDFPTIPIYQEARAKTRQRLGGVLFLKKDVEGAATELDEVMRIRRKLVATYPEVVGYRDDLARSLLEYSRVLLSRGTVAQARKAVAEAIDLFEKLVAAQPDSSSYLWGLAAAFAEDGDILYGNLGRPAEAEPRYQRQVELTDRLIKRFPGAVDFRDSHGLALMNLGNVLNEQGKLQASLDPFTRAIDLLTGPVGTDPRPTTARDSLRNAFWGRADSYGKLGRHAEAVRDWKAMIALIQSPQSQLPFRLKLAEALAESGDPAAGVAEASAVAAHPAADLVDVAATAGFIAAQAKEPKLTMAATLAAMGWLMEARRRGVLTDPKVVTRLRRDDRFALFRGRPEFDELFIPEIAPPPRALK